MQLKLNKHKLKRAVVIEFSDRQTEESLKYACKQIREKTGYYTNYIYVR